MCKQAVFGVRSEANADLSVLVLCGCILMFRLSRVPWCSERIEVCQSELWEVRWVMRCNSRVLMYCSPMTLPHWQSSSLECSQFVGSGSRQNDKLKWPAGPFSLVSPMSRPGFLLQEPTLWLYSPQGRQWTWSSALHALVWIRSLLFYLDSAEAGCSSSTQQLDNCHIFIYFPLLRLTGEINIVHRRIYTAKTDHK